MKVIIYYSKINILIILIILFLNNNNNNVINYVDIPMPIIMQLHATSYLWSISHISLLISTLS